MQKKNSSEELFDHHAATYDDDLAQGLSLTGEDKSYFARGRVKWLARQLNKLHFAPDSILDYGCGNGSTIPLLVKAFSPRFVNGVDSSSQSINIARVRMPEYSFDCFDKLPRQQKFSLIYCNGVLHHIKPEQRLATLNWINDHLEDGGIFALWENNPWNPATRLIMSRVPFDKGCVMLWPGLAKNMLRNIGMKILSHSYLFVFPNFLSGLRFIEPHIYRVPLGGQYLILSQKIYSNV